jgi:hypothetical protein
MVARRLNQGNLKSSGATVARATGMIASFRYVQCSMFNVQCSMFNVRKATTVVGWRFIHQRRSYRFAQPGVPRAVEMRPVTWAVDDFPGSQFPHRRSGIKKMGSGT